MKANELRIGNLVKHKNHEKPFKVFIIDTTETSFSSNIEPIPLTEERLVKLGFDKSKGKIDIYEKGRLRVWLGGRGQCLCYIIEENTTTGHYISSIEFVHQLQNLYFALTGEEFVCLL